jgi:iron complex transport system substrate-binding protein
MDTIQRIGNLLDARDRADSLVQDLKARIKRVRERAAQAARRPRVFFQIGITPIVSAGTPTLIHELIEIAGGRNVAEGSSPYPRFSREEVLALAPEVIVISSMARQAVFQEIKAQWEQWEQIPAAANGRVHLVDSDLFDRPSPRVVDGLEILAELIHPQASEAPH